MAEQAALILAPGKNANFLLTATLRGHYSARNWAQDATRLYWQELIV
jgi:hypothetical protein